MTIPEISIFIQNQKGKISNICELLGNNNLNIRGFSMVDTAEGYGIFHLIVDYSEKALELLKANQYSVALSDVIVVKIPDEPGGLSELLKLLAKEEQNIENIYAIANSFIVIKADEPLKASKVLSKNGITPISNPMEI